MNRATRFIVSQPGVPPLFFQVYGQPVTDPLTSHRYSWTNVLLLFPKPRWPQQTLCTWAPLHGDHSRDSPVFQGHTQRMVNWTNVASCSILLSWCQSRPSDWCAHVFAVTGLAFFDQTCLTQPPHTCVYDRKGCTGIVLALEKRSHSYFILVREMQRSYIAQELGYLLPLVVGRSRL